MKRLLVLIMLFPGLVLAEELEKEVYRETHQVLVKLDSTTVRCSALGYGMAELKVSVPELDWLSPFNHRSGGEGEPCMTAGLCETTWQEGLKVEDLLGAGDGEVQVPVTVVRTEKAAIQDDECFRDLQEVVTTTIRGLKFDHVRSVPLGTLTAAQCRALYQ